MVDLSVIIVNWNTKDILASCLNALEANQGGLNLEIIVVDNASDDGSQTMLSEFFPHVKLIANSTNVGFAKANNQGFQNSVGELILLLNSDAFIKPNTLRILKSVIDQNQKAGLVGAQLIYPDGTFQASYTDLPNLWQDFLIMSGLGRLTHGSWYPSHGPEKERGPQKAGYVEGACMLVRKEAYSAVQGLDENYFMYSEDVELCKAMQDHGWQVWYQPAAEVIHIGGGSSQHRRPEREADLYQSKVRFYRRHYGNMTTFSLKFLIYLFTFLKQISHSFLRLITGGRKGRDVVSIRYLATKLKEV